MNVFESKIFEKIMSDLEYDLISSFSNISVDWDDSNIYVSVGFDYYNQFSENNVSLIKSSYFVAEDEWSNVDEITNINDLKKHISDKNLVEKWNDLVKENEADILCEEVREYIINYLNDSYIADDIDNYVDEAIEDDVSVDAEEIENSIQSLNINVKYDDSDSFWTEDDFIEEWESYHEL